MIKVYSIFNKKQKCFKCTKIGAVYQNVFIITLL